MRSRVHRSRFRSQRPSSSTLSPFSGQTLTSSCLLAKHYDVLNNTDRDLCKSQQNTCIGTDPWKNPPSRVCTQRRRHLVALEGRLSLPNIGWPNTEPLDSEVVWARSGQGAVECYIGWDSIEVPVEATGVHFCLSCFIDGLLREERRPSQAGR